MTKSRAFAIVLLLFFLSILFRLPNLSRPVSKHHEFMTALILINIESWRQAAGGSTFHYVPLLNFQNPGDKYPEKNVWVDQQGNQWYFSLGPAWYIIPYFIYQIFHLPPEPIYLRIINLFFNLFSIAMLFLFLEQTLSPKISHKYELIVCGCFLFMFVPGILWYAGNGYAHTGIMLPFILALLIAVLPTFASPQKITFPRLFAISLLIILLVYTDWISVFLSVSIFLFSAWRTNREKKYLLLSVAAIVAISIGILLVFIQFSSYGGSQSVIAYWKARFFIRSVANGGTSLFVMSGWLIAHIITCFLPLIIVIAISFLLLKIRNKKIQFSGSEIFFIKFYTVSLVLYNLILMEWSYEHEFSVLPWAILFVFVAIRLMNLHSGKPFLYLWLSLFLIFSLMQYYFINLPGKIARDGMAYDNFKSFGEHLKNVPTDYQIYSDLEKRAPMIEYYSGRNIFIFPSQEEAKIFMQKQHVQKAVWVDQDNFRFKKIIYLTK